MDTRILVAIFAVIPLPMSTNLRHPQPVDLNTLHPFKFLQVAQLRNDIDELVVTIVKAETRKTNFYVCLKFLDIGELS